jgi:hypothetical protein
VNALATLLLIFTVGVTVIAVRLSRSAVRQ